MENNERVWEVKVPAPPPKVAIGDSEYVINPTDPFVGTILGLARGAGIGRFLVKFNGEVVRPEDAPETFEDYCGQTVTIEPVDEAG